VIADRQFNIPLPTAFVRGGFVGVACLIVAVFCYEAARVGWTTEQVGATDMKKVHAALVLDPNNPKLHNWAGILELFGNEVEPGDAIREFRTAADLNPRSAQYWANLGHACYIASDISCGKAAYDKAVAAAPHSPRVLNEAASFDLVTENTDDALPELRRLLEIDPSSASSALTMGLRALPPEVLWQSVVRDQHEPSVKLEYFELLSTQGMNEVAQRLWGEFVSSGPSLHLDTAKPYLAAMESQHDYADMARVWRDLERLHAGGMPARTLGNLIVNPRFENAPSNIGLDWHVPDEQFIEAQVVKTPDCGNALEVDYTVPNNAESEPGYQRVPVVPGQKYEIRALVRSAEITSDSGPVLRVTDPACAECISSKTEPTTGTTDWHEIASTFTAGATTDMVRVSIWRARSRVFPPEIRGQFWIRDVELTETK
jgi:tetratricopeptide (TPR) repeat protein